MEVECLGCGVMFVRDARHKNQGYCPAKPCQRKRKALWQKQKMATDPDYRLNQKRSWARWASNNPGYWREYRNKHPDKVTRNRVRQVMRDRRRKESPPASLAKMDASKPARIEPFGQFYLVPLLAKMDVLKVNIYYISSGYPILQKRTL